MNKQAILIMVDTQSATMLQLYNEAGVPCPNISRIAQNGAVFQNGYTVSPVCGPARSALFTGQYPSTNGVWANGQQLGQDIQNAAQRLMPAGVPCAYIGKWHLDGGDYFGKGTCAPGYDPNYWYDMRNFVDELPNDDTRKFSRKNMGSIMFGEIKEEDTYAHRVTERALKYIREHKDEDFFLTVSFDEPHDPSQCPKAFISELNKTGFKIKDYPNTNASLKDKPDIQKMWADAFKIPWPFLKMGFQKGFFPCNYFVDYEIGRILDAIDALKDPMIIYTADHGDMQNAHGLMAKGPAMYEEITHVPYIIKGGPFRNRNITTPVSHIDILPTVMEFFGLQKPRMLEGHSLYSIGDDDSREIYMQFGRFEAEVDGYLGFMPIRSVFDGRYKLNINLFSTDELYDLENDPYETKNLINDKALAKLRDALHDKIIAHQNEIVDPFRGYPWECRPWRKGKKPSFTNAGCTRQRCEDGTTRYDYATGCPVTSEVRAIGMK